LSRSSQVSAARIALPKCFFLALGSTPVKIVFEYAILRLGFSVVFSQAFRNAAKALYASDRSLRNSLPSSLSEKKNSFFARASALF
jgi:hypothetical protein